MKRIATVATIGATAMWLSMPVAAQWLAEPTRGIPRLADGKPNLSAAAPRTHDGKPDFTGLWSTPLHPGYLLNVAADLAAEDIEPEAARTFERRLDDLGKDDPSTIGCQPLGPRHITGGGLASRAKVVQTPTLIVVMHEDLTYRQIFMDGRKLEENPHPSFMGYSVGRWDGDELIVESFGFKEATWLDYGGHPHSERLRIMERYSRIDFGHMRRELTIIDPASFKKPITIASQFTLTPDTELLEYVCAETPRERFSLTSRTAKEQAIAVSVDQLRKYTGTYDFDGAITFGMRTLHVKLSGARLIVDVNGKGRVPLVPLSQNTFTPRFGVYEFIADDRGTVTHLLLHGVEGTFRANRRATSHATN